MKNNSIITNFSPSLVVKLQMNNCIECFLSLNDDKTFDKVIKEVHGISNIIFIHREEILFTKFDSSIFYKKNNLLKNDILWKQKFNENYLIKYLDLSSRYYDDFYFNDDYFKNIFPRIEHNIKKPYYYNLKNEFNVITNYFLSFIKENNINLFIQHFTPHEPNILLLDYICKELGVRRLFFHQIWLNGKTYYFLLEDIEDIGKFDTAVRLNKNPLNIKIANNYKKSLPYMEKKKMGKNYKTIDPGKLQDEAIVKIKKEREKTIFKKLNIFQYLLYRVCRILPYSIRQDYEFLRYNNQLSYFERVKEIATKEIDFNKKFIYFPLHLQPELTTMPLGFEYQDQLLALEHLSAILPKDWKIFVKENPKQTGAMRDNVWFNRFKTIPNTILVDTSVDTYKLIEKSQIVATITGTAGFEAVTGGKPSIIFGAAWYKLCDGVFEFNTDLDLEKIAVYKINHQKIQNHIDDLSLKLSDLQIDLSHVDEDDLSINFYRCNEEKIYRALSKAIKDEGQYLDDPKFLEKLENIRSQIFKPNIKKGSKILKIEHKFVKILCCFVPIQKYRKTLRNEGIVKLNKFLGKFVASFVFNKEKRKNIRKYFIDISDVR